MAAQNMHKLPVELARELALYLQPYDMVHLGMTSRAFHQIFTPLAFTDIKLAVGSCRALGKITQDLARLLLSCGALGHVRRLKVTKISAVAGSCKTLAGVGWDGEWLTLGEIFEPSEFQDQDEDQDEFMYREYDLTYREEHWKPLSVLVEHMSCLKDFIFDVHAVFPRVILDTLEMHLPRCRLSLGNLSIAGKDDRFLLIPNSADLFRSPSLYSVKFCHVSYATDDLTSIDEEVTKRFIRGIGALIAKAPNLEHLRVPEMQLMEYETSIMDIQGLSCHPLLPRTATTSNKALQTLSWNVYNDAPSKITSFWQSQVDFGLLVHLQIEIDYCNTENWSDWANWSRKNLDLPSLKSLKLSARFEFAGSKPAGLLKGMRTFLACLPPLEKVVIRGDYHAAAAKVLFNPKLTELIVSQSYCDGFHGQTFNKTLVEELVMRCPVLKRLKIPLRRSRGRFEEVEVYKLLGRLPRLRDLELQLICFRPKDDMEGSPGFWGWFSATVVNVAMDEALAKSIWRLVTCQETDGGSTRRLQSFRVQTKVLGNPYLTEFSVPMYAILVHLTRTYVVLPPLQDDDDTVSVQEINRNLRLNEEQSLAMPRLYCPHGHLSGPYGPACTLGETRRKRCLEQVRLLWPGDYADEEWKSHWKSFALEEVRRETGIGEPKTRKTYNTSC